MEVKERIIGEELKESYLDYSMSVIVGRALPDVRDGLKPVHRRVLFSMLNMGLHPNKPFVKSARIVGECFKYHPHGDAAIYDSLVRMAQDFSLRYPLVEGHGNFGCFTGDTKIKLLDGTSKSFKELCDLYKNGEKFYVYSINGDGSIVVGEARNPRITRKTAKLVEVVLDNGDKIRCTPNHRFLLKNMRYKEACNLTPKDSLMPGYFTLSPIKNNTHLNKYLMIKDNSKEQFVFVHDIVDQFNIINGSYSMNAGQVRHHKDFNKLNNDPSNIIRLSWAQHTRIHNEHIRALWGDEAFRAKQKKGVTHFYEVNPEKLEALKQRTIIRNKNLKFRENNSRFLKELWNDESLRANASARSKQRFIDDPKLRGEISIASRMMWADPIKKKQIVEHLRDVMSSDEISKKISNGRRNFFIEHPEASEIISACLVEYYRQNPEIRALISKRSKSLWKNETYRRKFVNENYNHFKNMAKLAWENESYKELQVAKIKSQWYDDNFRRSVSDSVTKRNLERIKESSTLMTDLAKMASVAHRVNWKNPDYKNQVIRNKILHYLNRLIGSIGTENVNEVTYEKYRTNDGSPKFENAVKYFDNFEEMLLLAKRYNHYAVSVKLLDYCEDVYDITVNKYHNFLLDTGVFVHNSIDGFEQAAMRYTEAKLSKISEEIITDIDKETVNFVPNFDGSLEEPVVLPTKLPNLLVNGSSGIAVGMATNVPPHNVSEVCDALIAFIDDHDIDANDLIKYIKGPDFPTGGIIQGLSGIRQAYKTGRGKVVLRAKTEIEKNKIIIIEIPYQVNKSSLIESIAELVKEKRIDGITNIRDESDKTGMRIVVDVRQNVQADVILNQLYQHTQLQSSFGIIMLALVNNQPKILPLKDLLDEFVKFRVEVVTRRTKYELRKAEEKMHILEGLIVALKNIDAIVKLIKSSKDGAQAKNSLIEVYRLSEIQAQSILDMKLQRLTSLEQDKINNEHKELSGFAKECREILASSSRILGIIKNELLDIKNKYGDSRRTDIVEFEDDLTTEDLIEDEEVVVTLTNTGYVKRLPLDTYKAQKRGGKGIQATGMKEDDFVQDILITRTHTNLLFFTNKGKVHWIRAFMVPEGSRYAKGTSVVNLLSLESGEVVRSLIAVDAFIDNAYLIFATKKGIVKKTELKEYANPRKGGIIAINLREDDDLVDVKMTDSNKEILMATKDGRAVRFNEKDVSVVGRNSIGVRGINVKTSEVIGMEIVSGKYVLTVTQNGYGKLTEVEDYRLINRGGSGVINIKITDKNGKVVGIKIVDDEEEVMFIAKDGMLIRTPVSGISKVGRNTQGVRLMRLDEGDSVVGLGKIAKEVD